MPDENAKQERKQILHELRAKASEEFEKNLPMSRGNFKKLFDYLDTELGNKDCDDTSSLTRAFLQQIGIDNAENVLEWLNANGGYCDCEILANVEEQFE